MVWHWVVPLLFLCLWAAPAQGQDAAAPAPLPEGDNGIAAKYLGDAGIERDPAVVFADGFEECSTPADLRKKWDAVFHENTLRIAAEPENVSGGRKAIEMTFPQRAEPVGDGLMKHLKEERDVLFLRFYTKYEKGLDVTGAGSFHNGGSLSAHYHVDGVSTPGKRADGRNKFLVGYECTVHSSAPPPGYLMCYVYHPEQLQAFGDIFFPSGCMQPGGRTAEVGKKYFGPSFVPRPEVCPELDRWHCYELMVKANTVGQRDGRIACWLNGRLIADFPNLRFRDVESLKMDYLGVGGYINPNKVRTNKIWFDDVVAATSYIGPLARERKAQPKPEPPKPVVTSIEKPPPPAIKAEALAPWEAKLVERVVRGVKEGQRPAASMKAMGAREEPVKVVGADAKSLSVEIQGSALSLPWARITAGDRTNLARAFLKEDSPEDHILVAVFALAGGRTELSDEHFAKAKAADSKGGEAQVAEARASLGLK